MSKKTIAAEPEVLPAAAELEALCAAVPPAVGRARDEMEKRYFAQIVHHRQTHSQHLLRLEQVAEIGPGKAPAGGTAAALVNRPPVQLIFLIFDVQASLPGEQLPMAGVPGSPGCGKSQRRALPSLPTSMGGGFLWARRNPCKFSPTWAAISPWLSMSAWRTPRLTATSSSPVSGRSAVAIAVDFRALLHRPDPQVFVSPPLVDAKKHLPWIKAIWQGVQPVMLLAW